MQFRNDTTVQFQHNKIKLDNGFIWETLGRLLLGKALNTIYGIYPETGLR